MTPRIKTLGIRDQAAWLRGRNPDFRCRVYGGLLICGGPLNDIVIHYRAGTWPKVYIPGTN